MTPDVNVVVAASRSDHPQHRQSMAWLNRALLESAQGASFKLLPMVVASTLRLVTHPKIFIQPTPIEEAIAFIDAVLAASGVQMPNQSAEWPKLRSLCIDRQLSANALPDAWLAATVLHMDDHLVTFDAGFRQLLPARSLTLLNGKA